MKFGLECYEGEDSTEKVLLVSIDDENEVPAERWLDFEELGIRIPAEELRRLLDFNEQLK